MPALLNTVRPGRDYQNLVSTIRLSIAVGEATVSKPMLNTNCGEKLFTNDALFEKPESGENAFKKK